MRLVTYVDVNKRSSKRVMDRLDKLSHLDDDSNHILNIMGDDLVQRWAHTVPKYFKSTSAKPVATSDNKAIINGKWQIVPPGYHRSSSGRLKHAARCRVSENGRVSIYLIPLPQQTSDQAKWQNVDVVTFLSKGTKGGAGGYDPAFNKRKIRSDDGHIHWFCGSHPGTTNKQWKLLQADMRIQVRDVVDEYIPLMIRNAL